MQQKLAGDVAQMVEFLPSMYKTLGLIHSTISIRHSGKALMELIPRPAKKGKRKKKLQL